MAGMTHNSSAALARCMSREVSTGSALLRRVLRDLLDVAEFCAGRARPTNPLRALVSDLGRGQTPKPWAASYKCAASAAAACDVWLADFGRRIAHSLELARPFQNRLPPPKGEGGDSAEALALDPAASSETEAAAPSYWLGGMFNPEAFITASRQHTAQHTGLALDDLYPALALSTKKSSDASAGGHAAGSLAHAPLSSACSFVLRGLVLEGSAWDLARQELVLGDGSKSAVKEARFCWVGRQSQDSGSGEHGSSSPGAPAATLATPLYLNDGREVLLATVNLRCGSQPALLDLFYQRGAALVAWSE